MIIKLFTALKRYIQTLLLMGALAVSAANAQVPTHLPSATMSSTPIPGVGLTVTTATITLLARTDTYIIPAGQNATMNIAGNDTMPAGSGWFLMSSTCTPPPNMSPNGMLNVTSPSPAGSTCSATYKACRGGANLPLPNVNCSTAIVLISSPTQGTLTTTVTVVANPDATTLPAGSSSSFNVVANDVSPTGWSAVVTLGTGSTCAGASVSTAGIASYTAPATPGASCTVVYQACFYATLSSTPVCRTSALTVTAQAISTTFTFSLLTDSATVTAGQIGQTNVLQNDTYPLGSTVTQGSGSTCAGATVNSQGIATYTAPAAGVTCTVVYQVCEPAVVWKPPLCRISTLIVTGK